VFAEKIIKEATEEKKEREKYNKYKTDNVQFISINLLKILFHLLKRI